MKTTIWENCYPSQWKGVIVEDAIVHPAKFSSRLIRRIYEHMIEMDWVSEGDTVIDPFGGVALGALDALRLGLRWRGVELEQRFVELGNANIAHWNSKFGSMPKWSGDAVLLQGDSRNLVKALEGSGKASVSSPPYKTETEGQGLNVNRPATFRGVLKTGTLSMGESDGQLGNMQLSDKGFQASISSPPFLQSEGGTPEPKPGGVIDAALYARHQAGNAAAKGYGETDSNLGNMRGDEEGFRAAISSPPYADGAQNTGGDDTHPEHIKGGKIHLPGIAGAVSSPPYAESMERKGGIDPEKSEHAYGPHSQMANSDTRYGSTNGQLGAMPARDESYQASVSSPPFMDNNVNIGAVGDTPAKRQQIHDAEKRDNSYGLTEGQLGNDSGSDFWLAARVIVEQTYAALSPGAHAVWVVKGFVKNKKYVDFPDQWRQLCEAVGFVTLHEHRAMLVHHKGTQGTLDGGAIELKTESKSFFRRLAEKNGSPKIDFETVYCMEKPQ